MIDLYRFLYYLKDIYGHIHEWKCGIWERSSGKLKIGQPNPRIIMI